MQAGILALLGGSNALTIETTPQKQSDTGMLANRPFQQFMQSASQDMGQQFERETVARMIQDVVQSSKQTTQQLLQFFQNGQTDIARLLDPAIAMKSAGAKDGFSPSSAMPLTGLIADIQQLPSLPIDFGTPNAASFAQISQQTLVMFSNIGQNFDASMQSMLPQQADELSVEQLTQMGVQSKRMDLIDLDSLNLDDMLTDQTVDQLTDYLETLPDDMPVVLDVTTTQTITAVFTGEIPVVESVFSKLTEMMEEMLPEQLVADATQLSQEALPMVAFAPASEAFADWQPWLQQQAIASVEIVTVSLTRQNGAEFSNMQSMMDDLAQLGKDELQKLDRVIENLTSQTGKQFFSKDGAALQDFRQAIEQQLAQQARLAGAEQPRPQTSGASAEPAMTADNSAATASSSTQGLSASSQQNADMQLRVWQATPTQLPVNAPPAEQVKVSIQQAINAGHDRVVVQLDPTELGRVEVRIDNAQEGRVQITVLAEQKDTLDLLQRDARLLEKALQEAGIDAHEQDMAFDLQQQQQDSDESGTEDANLPLEIVVLENSSPPLIEMDSVTGEYTLSMTQGLNIKV